MGCGQNKKQKDLESPRNEKADEEGTKPQQDDQKGADKQDGGNLQTKEKEAPKKEDA